MIIGLVNEKKENRREIPMREPLFRPMISYLDDNIIVILYDENKTEPLWLQPRAGRVAMDGRKGGEE
jgi:hypothetical protein